MPLKGGGTKPNPQEGLRWLRAAAIKGEVAAAFIEKHGVVSTTAGGSSRAMKPADVGDRAKRFAVRVECLA